jgi:hypothetical protein
MTMTPSVRKLVLATHLTLSVGWIGAVLAYLALVIAAMTTQEAQTLRAAWIAMDLIGWYVIVPLALTSLATGLGMSLGTPWGLFRHYWILFSLGLTTLATVILLQHMRSVSVFAALAAITPSAATGELRVELVHAGLGLLVLLAVQVMNVYKPRGLTPYGWRKQQEQRAARAGYGAGAGEEAAP